MCRSGGWARAFTSEHAAAKREYAVESSSSASSLCCCYAVAAAAAAAPAAAAMLHTSNRLANSLFTVQGAFGSPPRGGPPSSSSSRRAFFLGRGILVLKLFGWPGHPGAKTLWMAKWSVRGTCHLSRIGLLRRAKEAHYSLYSHLSF